MYIYIYMYIKVYIYIYICIYMYIYIYIYIYYRNPFSLLRCHELNRVFYDRLVDLGDCSWFREMTVGLVAKHFDTPMAKLFR